MSVTLTAVGAPESDNWREEMPIWAHMIWWRLRHEYPSLRRRRDEVLYYISQIDNPNPQTLWHIRNILTGDDSIYGVPDGH